MTIQHDVHRLMATRQARIDHAARRAPMDDVTKFARLALILDDPRLHPRLAAILDALRFEAMA